MKKSAVAIVLLVILCALASCQQGHRFSAQYVRAGRIRETDAYKTAIVIRSTEQLQAYCPDIDAYSYSHNGEMSFKEVMAKYDVAFFQENLLVIVLLEEGSGSIRHKVTSVETGDEGIAINIKRKLPSGAGTDDMAYWHVLVELKKSDIPESADFVVHVTEP